VIEVAALLHDIGKLGVPDAILFKPGALSEKEWKVMQQHDRMGVDIIASAFASPELTQIVKNHHAWHGGNPRDPSLPRGEDIPIGARLLSIADAFDAMVSDRVYRKGRSAEEAFAELRRCAGQQFDPELVERFIQSVVDANTAQPTVLRSRQRELQAGLHVEKLVAAVDGQDRSMLASMAASLRVVAREQGMIQIAELAGQLHSLAANRGDWLDILQRTTMLAKLYRERHCQSSTLPEAAPRSNSEDDADALDPRVVVASTNEASATA
jgi:hypothetical protein